MSTVLIFFKNFITFGAICKKQWRKKSKTYANVMTVKSSQFQGSRRKVKPSMQKPLAIIFISDSNVYMPVNVYLEKIAKIIILKKKMLFFSFLIHRVEKDNISIRIAFLDLTKPVFSIYDQDMGLFSYCHGNMKSQGPQRPVTPGTGVGRSHNMDSLHMAHGFAGYPTVASGACLTA